MNFRIFLLFMCVFGASLSNAVPVIGLYEAEIKLPASEPEDKILTKAFGLAVESVLVKVSGDKVAISADLLKEAKSKAPTWVAQHSVASLSELLMSNGELVAGKQVRVAFYEASIDEFLSKNNLPVWGSDRPSSLVWLVNEDNGLRSLSGTKAPSEALNILARASGAIGLPVYAPLLDDEDQRTISTTDVWGFFEDSILKASERYQTDAVAALKISNYVGKVSGGLLVLLKNGETERFDLSGDTLNDVLGLASVHIAKVLSSRYAAVRSSDSINVLDVQVSGVSDYAIMRETQSYLEALGVVKSVNLAQISGENVRFSLEVNGDKERLLNGISLNRLLVRESPSTREVEDNNLIAYQYVGEIK
ncbi:DUF2066 domain-containing protein [Marinomonas sp. C2222]|uniref:DUF2066 domain-containing protein n=1 Tax=Marinomonas sargassi TaxID=2984494 RepID=A0ABT2YRD1_9GAMM|nr:DUF2066 domain-containing protein [Marinomonas sargassi]MCV2402305.1 DUF2066 domain-containing protein [Marinomonas sargassi]